MKSIFKILIGIIGLFLATNVFAQDADLDLASSTPEERAQMQTDKLAEKITMDDDQKEQLYAINLKYAEEIQPVLESDQSKISKLQEVKSINKDKDEEIKEIFNEEQYAAYEEMKKEVRKDVKQRYRSRRGSLN
ncbi:hypothetical protein [Chondrinema litorale]|uniref:hypothetical protein n=1 Tax=Chondrinema litorale TaxID=2994555 RepID=UPI002543C9B1|nr:hypothetical protein [Chondrinema litorale]UZR97781.1 hypothetical protein OQ292_27625 [Chondrinema litorale]